MNNNRWQMWLILGLVLLALLSYGVIHWLMPASGPSSSPLTPQNPTGSNPEIHSTNGVPGTQTENAPTSTWNVINNNSDNSQNKAPASKYPPAPPGGRSFHHQKESHGGR